MDYGVLNYNFQYPFQNIRFIFSEIKDEISQMKKACGNSVKLKTILATGELVTNENIVKASQIAIESGICMLFYYV